MNRAGTEYDIDNLVEDTYKDMYFELVQHYNYELKQNELLKEKMKRLLKEIEQLRFNEIIQETITQVELKYKEIELILDKYK